MQIENVNMNLTFVEEDAVMFEVTGKSELTVSAILFLVAC